MIIFKAAENLIWEESNRNLITRGSVALTRIFQAEVFEYKNEDVAIRSTISIYEYNNGDSPFAVVIHNYTHTNPDIMSLEFHEDKTIGNEYKNLSEAKNAAQEYFNHYHRSKHL